MVRNDDNDPTDTRNPASAVSPVPPTLNSPPPALPSGFTGVPKPAATSGIVRPDNYPDSGSSDFDPVGPRPTSAPSLIANPNIGNGVPTISGATVPKGYIDVTGTATSTSDSAPMIQRPTPSTTFNGRTYSGADLDKLANTNVVSSEGFRNPGIGTLGVPVSPDAGVAMAMNIQRPVAQAAPSDAPSQPPTIQRPGSYDPSGAARDYRTDLASIVNKDPRSTLGTAAWNAYADSVWDRNTGNGRQGAANYQNKIGALLGAAKGDFDAQNQAGVDDAKNQTSWADNANTNAANVSRSGLLANSRLGAADARADAMNYGADTRADATRYAADARANTPKIDLVADAAYSRTYQAVLNKGGTTDQARDAATKARSDLVRMRQPGSQVAQDDAQASTPAPQSPDPSRSTPQRTQQPLPQPPPAAIQYLKQYPHFADQFDAKYGNGASAQYLRNQ